MVTTPDDAAYDEWIDQLREEWRNDPGFLDETRNDEQIIAELYHDFARVV